MIRILQFFGNVDMRKGEYALSLIEGVDRTNLKDREVYIFRNNDMRQLAILSRDSITKTKKLPGKETWDWKTRKEQILKLICKSLGLQFTADDKVYREAGK